MVFLSSWVFARMFRGDLVGKNGEIFQKNVFFRRVDGCVSGLVLPICVYSQIIYSGSRDNTWASFLDFLAGPARTSWRGLCTYKKCCRSNLSLQRFPDSSMPRSLSSKSPSTSNPKMRFSVTTGTAQINPHHWQLLWPQSSGCGCPSLHTAKIIP